MKKAAQSLPERRNRSSQQKKTPRSPPPKRELFKNDISPTPSEGKLAPRKGIKKDAEKLKMDIKSGRRRSPRIQERVLGEELTGVAENEGTQENAGQMQIDDNVLEAEQWSQENEVQIEDLGEGDPDEDNVEKVVQSVVDYVGQMHLSQSPGVDLSKDDHPDFSPKVGAQTEKFGAQPPANEAEKTLSTVVITDGPSFSLQLGLTQTPPKKNQVESKPPKKVDPSDIRVVHRRKQPFRAAKQYQRRNIKNKRGASEEVGGEIEEMEFPTTVAPKHQAFEDIPYIHKMGKPELPFDVWIVSALEKTRVTLPVVAFRSPESTNGWSFSTDSIFSDNGEIPVEKIAMADKTWSYLYRNLLSDEVSNILDEWVRKYHTNELTITDYPFINDESNIFCNIHNFKELVFSENQIGPEVCNFIV